MRPAAGLPLEPFGTNIGGLVLVSLFFPVYYLGASWLISWRIWTKQRNERQLPSPLAGEGPGVRGQHVLTDGTKGTDE
jgi:hypothetical protein